MREDLIYHTITEQDKIYADAERFCVGDLLIIEKINDSKKGNVYEKYFHAGKYFLFKIYNLYFLVQNTKFLELPKYARLVGKVIELRFKIQNGGRNG